METELFVHFAEIAGVFVGFGALISMRAAHPTDVHDVTYMRAVLGIGVGVVIAALTPIALSRYGVDGHTLWLPCALVYLALWAILVILLNRTPESHAINTSPERMDRLFPVVGLPLHLVIVGSLILLVLGVWNGVDEALYVTALTGGVVFAGYTLLAAAMSQTPEPEPDADRPRADVARPSAQ